MGQVGYNSFVARGILTHKGERMTKDDKESAMLQDKKGKRVEIKVGAVLETETPKARTPLIVWKITRVPMGKDTIITEYSVAGKDRVSLNNSLTAFQLERYGYKVAGYSKGFDPKTVKEPDTKIEIELVPVEGENGEKGVDMVAKKVPAKGSEKKAGKGSKTPVVASKAEKEVEIAPEQSKRERAVELLDQWVWGIQPDNFKEIEAELVKLGIPVKGLADQIQVTIDRVVDSAFT